MSSVLLFLQCLPFACGVIRREDPGCYENRLVFQSSDKSKLLGGFTWSLAVKSTCTFIAL